MRFLSQVYHYCHHDGRQDSFLCPKGTVFNQKVFVCDWWYNADCGSSHGFYSLNDDLYSVRWGNNGTLSSLNVKTRLRDFAPWLCV